MNVFKDMFISFNTTHERDGRTDTHTDTARRHRPQARIKVGVGPRHCTTVGPSVSHLSPSTHC